MAQQKKGPDMWDDLKLGSIIRGTPSRAPLLNPTFGSLKRDLIERVYIPKGPPNPSSHEGFRTSGLVALGLGLLALGHSGLDPADCFQILIRETTAALAQDLSPRDLGVLGFGVYGCSDLVLRCAFVWGFGV